MVQKYIKKISGSFRHDLSITHVHIDTRNNNPPAITTIPKQSSEYSSFDRRRPLGHRRTTSSLTQILNYEPNSESVENNIESSFHSLQTVHSPQPIPDTLICSVITPFHTLSRHDEIALNPGDLVQVDVTFHDDWGFGTNRTTGLRGYFPMTSFIPLIDQNIEFKGAPSLDLLKVPLDHDVKMSQTIRSGSLRLTGPVLDTPKANSSVFPLKESKDIFADVSTPPKTELLTVLPVIASRDDELDLTPGDRVFLEVTYLDGWGYGTSMSQSGYFPLNSCIVFH
ncbi:hypothetical protein HK096_003939 [Nowakowskiella sp. JEL0078]|nr:hypothetical protein HK096_003939 [Nowakowskiella sp. JEL0078]